MAVKIGIDFFSSLLNEDNDDPPPAPPPVITVSPAQIFFFPWYPLMNL